VPHWFALLQPWFYSFSKKRNQFSFRFGFSGIDNHCYYSKSTLTFTVTYFVFQYKPIESVSDNCYLHVQWLFSLQRRKNVSNWYSIANEWLPAHKIQILAIDDGRDDTWYWMNKAKRRTWWPCVVVQQPENKGERDTLYTVDLTRNRRNLCNHW
jgi:hyaluronan synthase